MVQLPDAQYAKIKLNDDKVKKKVKLMAYKSSGSNFIFILSYEGINLLLKISLEDLEVL